MAAFASSNTATGTGSAVVTKPSGLAAGDLMVAFVDGDPSSTTTTPSGWTIIRQSTHNGFDTGTFVFAKIASADDAAATNFTFSNSNGSAAMRADLFRITGTLSATNNIYTSVIQLGSDTADDVYRFATGISPSIASSLLIMHTFSLADGNNDSTGSNYLIETNNPSWTEVHDTAWNSQSFASTNAYATRTETTDTGYYQVSFASAGDVTQSLGVLLAIADTQNASPTIDVITLSASVQAISPTANADVSAPDVLTLSASLPSITPTTADPLWKNDDKPSAGSITNTDKP